MPEEEFLCKWCGVKKPLANWPKVERVDGSITKKGTRCYSCLNRLMNPERRKRQYQRASQAAASEGNKAKKREYDRKRYQKIKADPLLGEVRRFITRRATIAYYYRHTEKCLNRLREWRKTNPEKRDAQKERWRQKYIHRILGQQKRRYWKNREHNMAQSRAWYRQNKEYAKVRSIRWARANRDLCTQYANRRRKMEYGSPGSHTLEEWAALKELYGQRCYYCGKQGLTLTRDHVQPLARGGSDDIDNIVPACRSCNSSKARLTVDEFVARKYAS